MTGGQEPIPQRVARGIDQHQIKVAGDPPMLEAVVEQDAVGCGAPT